jgi:8-oxo-dGTP pyrophosphatase MutT (NUDIX family)
MIERIQKVLADYQRQELHKEELVPAGVVVPLFEKDGGFHLLMERRTEKVLKHRGQISYPGGVRDPEDDDIIQTALREAWEEVGLKPEDVDVLGLLGDIETITGFLVTPVVAKIPYPYEFRPSTDEVAELLEVPWKVFVEGWGYRREKAEYQGEMHTSHFYQYNQHTIWGATARITRELVNLVENI